METLAQFGPLAILTIVLAAFASPMTKRKGLGLGVFLRRLMPLIGGFARIWVASKTDKAVLDRLAELERRETV